MRESPLRARTPRVRTACGEPRAGERRREVAVPQREDEFAGHARATESEFARADLPAGLKGPLARTGPPPRPATPAPHRLTRRRRPKDGRRRLPAHAPADRLPPRRRDRRPEEREATPRPGRLPPLSRPATARTPIGPRPRA